MRPIFILGSFRTACSFRQPMPCHLARSSNAQVKGGASRDRARCYSQANEDLFARSAAMQPPIEPLCCYEECLSGCRISS